MGRRQLVPLSMETIKNGQFVPQLNSLLDEACGSLISYMKKWGERAEGAKAKLDISVTIVCENADPTSEAFSVKATHKLSVPTAPPVVFEGHADEKQTGEMTLLVPFVEDPPEEHQGHLPLDGEERKPGKK